MCGAKEELCGLWQFHQVDEAVHRLTGGGEVVAGDAAVVEAFEEYVLRSLPRSPITNAAGVIHSVCAASQIIAEIAMSREELSGHEVSGDPRWKVLCAWKEALEGVVGTHGRRLCIAFLELSLGPVPSGATNKILVVHSEGDVALGCSLVDGGPFDLPEEGVADDRPAKQQPAAQES